MSDLTPRERIDRAHRMVGDLCNPVETGRRWVMSIPARPDYDPDLVISDGLSAGAQALDRLEAAEALLRDILPPLDLPMVLDLRERVKAHLALPPIRAREWRTPSPEKGDEHHA